jgi:hypothetical protein
VKREHRLIHGAGESVQRLVLVNLDSRSELRLLLLVVPVLCFGTNQSRRIIAVVVMRMESGNDRYTVYDYASRKGAGMMKLNPQVRRLQEKKFLLSLNHQRHASRLLHVKDVR